MGVYSFAPSRVIRRSTLAVAIHLFDTEHLPEELCEGQEESNIITPHDRVIPFLFPEKDSGVGVS